MIRQRAIEADTYRRTPGQFLEVSLDFATIRSVFKFNNLELIRLDFDLILEEILCLDTIRAIRLAENDNRLRANGRVHKLFDAHVDGSVKDLPKIDTNFDFW